MYPIYDDTKQKRTCFARRFVQSRARVVTCLRRDDHAGPGSCGRRRRPRSRCHPSPPPRAHARSQTSHYVRTAKQDMSIGLQPSNEALALGTVDENSTARPAPRQLEGSAALIARASEVRAWFPWHIGRRRRRLALWCKIGRETESAVATGGGGGGSRLACRQPLDV